jgi:hypothetical protein
MEVDFDIDEELLKKSKQTALLPSFGTTMRARRDADHLEVANAMLMDRAAEVPL